MITGSNSDIGLGVAWAMAGAGAVVALNWFNDTPSDHALAQEIAEAEKILEQYPKPEHVKSRETA